MKLPSVDDFRPWPLPLHQLFRTSSESQKESKNTVIYTAAILGVGVLIGLLVFFWKQVGAGSGRVLRNRVAAHLGISRSLFRSLLVHGVKGSPRDLLASLENSKLSLEQASIKLGPSLARGIERLEARFGPQDTIDEVKPIVARLVPDADQKSNSIGEPKS
jgi:hypothetical protein